MINALESILQCWKRGMKSESGFSFAMASQPFETILFPNYSFWPTTTELSLSLSSLYGGPGQAWDRDFKMTMIMNVLQTKNE